MSSNENYIHQLKSIIDLIKPYWLRLKKLLPVCLIISMLVGFWQYRQAKNEDPKFTTYATFMTTEKKFKSGNI